MTSHPAGECCVSGFKHEGTSVGEIKEIDGVKTYITGKSSNAILYLCDAFGLELVNNRLLADYFATCGYMVVMPDLFHGEPVPESVLQTGLGSFDFPSWIAKHPVDGVDKVVAKTLKYMKEIGCKKIGSVGYCFGGKYVVRTTTDAGFIAHPSFVEKEELEALKIPLSIAAAETDMIFPAPKRRESEDILQKLGIPYQLSLYGGVEHGFAVRTDLKDKRKRFAKESAAIQAIRWFDEFVKE